MPLGGIWAVHDNPPVVVATIVEPAASLPVLPTATQSSVAEHEMLVRSTAFAGGAWDVQVDPLFNVPMT